MPSYCFQHGDGDAPPEGDRTRLEWRRIVREKNKFCDYQLDLLSGVSSRVDALLPD